VLVIHTSALREKQQRVFLLIGDVLANAEQKKSKIKNQESRIKNQTSKIKNQKSNSRSRNSKTIFRFITIEPNAIKTREPFLLDESNRAFVFLTNNRIRTELQQNRNVENRRVIRNDNLILLLWRSHAMHAHHSRPRGKPNPSKELNRLAATLSAHAHAHATKTCAHTRACTRYRCQCSRLSLFLIIDTTAK
jgi:hypothetical protein